MKTLKSKITARNFFTIVLPLFSCAFFLWYGMHFPGPVPTTAEAVVPPTPTPTCTPSTLVADPIPPTATPCESPGPYNSAAHILPDKYQPGLNQPQLMWVEFPMVTTTPTPTPPPGGMPAVMFIHGSSWYGGNPLDIENECEQVATKGYFVVSVIYRLARDGYIHNQPCHADDDPTVGWMLSQQMKDIEAQIGALREDSRCNGNVGIVAGSAGCTLALLAGFDTRVDGDFTWPHWSPSKRPNCVALLSLPADLSDLRPPSGQSVADPDFVRGTQNVVNSALLTYLQGASPVAKVPNWNDTYGEFPLFMVNSWFDHPTPYQQIVDMICALQAHGWTTFQTLTINSGHSFHYWGAWDGSGTPSQTVGKDVVVFLDAHLK